VGVGVDGVDDLGTVDALQVDRRNAEARVSELALDHDQRDALARHLDGVRVAELVRSEAPRPHRRPHWLVRRQGGAREVGMDEWAGREQLQPGSTPAHSFRSVRCFLHRHRADPRRRMV